MLQALADTQSLASIVAGGIAFGFPENSNATVAANKSRFNLWDSKAEALKSRMVYRVA